VKVTFAVLVATLLAMTGSLAFAQSGIPHGDGPGGVPVGAGTQRGIQGLNNSGQTGFVTLFERGSRSAVVVAIEGAHGRAEHVAFVRGRSCDSVGNDVVYRLNDLSNGISRGYAPMTLQRLMSGNYLTIIYSGTHPVACGELFN
jgi:hypothetical protein